MHFMFTTKTLFPRDSVSSDNDVSGYVSPRPREYDAEFHEVNDAVQATAEDTAGYLGKRTWHASDSEEVLVVYYWESLDRLSSFGDDATHERAKRRWTEWYDAYEVTVTEVLESYGSGFGDDADPPA